MSCVVIRQDFYTNIIEEPNSINMIIARRLCPRGTTSLQVKQLTHLFNNNLLQEERVIAASRARLLRVHRILLSRLTADHREDALGIGVKAAHLICVLFVRLTELVRAAQTSLLEYQRADNDEEGP